MLRSIIHTFAGESLLRDPDAFDLSILFFSKMEVKTFDALITYTTSSHIILDRNYKRKEESTRMECVCAAVSRASV